MGTIEVISFFNSNQVYHCEKDVEYSITIVNVQKWSDT